MGGEGEDALEENIKLYGLLQPISIFVYSLKQIMKKLIPFLFSIVLSTSCDKSDDIPDIQECLVCSSLSPSIDISLSELEGFCVGTTGEKLSTGENGTLSKQDIQEYASFFNALGATCSVQ